MKNNIKPVSRHDKALLLNFEIIFSLV